MEFRTVSVLVYVVYLESAGAAAVEWIVELYAAEFLMSSLFGLNSDAFNQLNNHLSKSPESLID